MSDQLETLIERLARRTAARNIEWTPGPSEGAFVWSGSSASIQVSSKDNDAMAPWIVELFDSEGRLVETVEYSHDSRLATEIQRMFLSARRQALHVDQTIDDLLNELGDVDDE